MVRFRYLVSQASNIYCLYLGSPRKKGEVVPIGIEPILRGFQSRTLTRCDKEPYASYSYLFTRDLI